MSVKYKIAKEFESFKPLILGIKSFFKDSKVSIHKARNEIKILKFNDSQVVAKSFKKPNFFNRIVYSFFRDSKAKKSYMYARKIAHFTPCAIGYIEFFENKLLGESYFVSEKFEYDFTIREPLLEPNFDSRKQIFKEFALFAYALHVEGILHLDFSPGNILIKKTDENFIFKIVDINRMRFGEISLKQRLKSFSKLWAKDEDLRIIAKEYVRVASLTDGAVEEILNYSKTHKRVKNFKKWLKGQEVVD